MKRTRLVFFLTLATGCAGLIGVPDLTFDEKAPQGNPDAQASNPEGGRLPDGALPNNEGGSGACVANLETDPSHCGRCDHSCAGGACTAGKCEPVVLVSAVGGPEQIAVDDTFLYFTASGENALRRIKKDGSGTVETMMSGDTLDRIMGVVRDGTTLYFSGGDVIHKCTLGPAIDACSTSHSIIADLYFVRHLAYANGFVFAEANGDIYRVAATGLPKPDASYSLIPTPIVQPWSVAANNEWVYVTSLTRSLYRAQFDGGGATDIGPLDSEIRGSYVTVEGDGVFWSYKEDGVPNGQVYGQKHANPADRINYTSQGGYPIGIAADPQYVYWADQGTVAGDPPGPTGDGKVYACPRGGCGAAPLVLATGLKGGGSMIVDDKAVYFVENDGTFTNGRIRKVAKP